MSAFSLSFTSTQSADGKLVTMTDNSDLKKCSKCKTEKRNNDFHKDKYNADGLTNACKVCRIIYKNNWSKNNPEKHLESAKKQRVKIYARDKEKIKEASRLYRESNKEKCSDYQKEYIKNNKEKIKQYHKEKWALNKEHGRDKRREYYLKNAEKIKERQRNYNKHTTIERSIYAKEYRDKNRQKTIQSSCNYIKKRIAVDPIFKLKKNLKCRIVNALKRNSWKKDSSTRDILGADCAFVKKYIERQFEKGMTWKNHGVYGWHLDHIIPISTAQTKEDLLILCHYTNLQPLWAKENIIKSNKIIPTQMKIAI